MERWIYSLDLAVVIMLVAGVIGGAITMRKRAGEGSRDLSALAVVLVGFLLLHVWGHFRPVPVVVESTRKMTPSEKLPWIGRGIPADMLENMHVTEVQLFDGTNAGDWNRAEIFRMKGLLAWNGVLPRLPRRIVIRATRFAKDSPSAVAEYDSVCYKQKTIVLRKYEWGWTQEAPRFQGGCSPPPLTSWQEIVLLVPVGLRIY